jgi:MFS transporter, DHA1 family, multidrug resistance protein
MLEAFGIGMLFPLLARIQHAHHLPTYGLGIMSGASFFSSLLAQILISPYLDGRRARPVMLGGLVLTALAFAWFGASTTLWAFAVSRALGGAGAGICVPASLRAGTVGVDAERRGQRIGRLASAQMSGIVLGPVVGIGLVSIGNLSTPFYVDAVLIGAVAVALAIMTSGAPVPDLDEDGRPVVVTRSRRPAWPPIIAVLLVSCASQLPNGFYDALWSRLLTDRGGSSLLIGVSLTLYGLPFMVLAPLGGRLAGRHKPITTAAFSLIVASVFMASYGLVRSPVVIAALGIFEACVQSLAVPGVYASVSEVFPDDWAATGQGWASGAGTASAGAAALISAPAYGALGPGPVFVGGAVCSAGFALGSLVLTQRSSGLRRVSEDVLSE